MITGDPKLIKEPHHNNDPFVYREKQEALVGGGTTTLVVNLPKIAEDHVVS